MPEPIADAEKAAKLFIRKQAFMTDLDRLGQSLVDGRITLGMYEEDFRTRMRQYLTGAAMIGKGDPEAMTSSDWGKVGAQLKKQYNWLHGFTQSIYDNRETVSLAAINARAHLYAEAGTVVANEIQAGYFAPNTRRVPVNILPWIPGDGSTRCLNRCGCQWILEVMEILQDQGVKTVQATWVLHPEKEHCEDCAPRDGRIELVEVPVDEDVPPFIGLGFGV